jgi:hypothetical protein
MNEAGVWKYIKEGMKSFWLASRIESSAGNGIPDVVFTLPSVLKRNSRHGFMELKYIPEWPKKEDTLIKLPLRQEQKIWIMGRGAIAGGVWVLVRIADTFFILDYKQVIQTFQGLPKAEWYKFKHWEKKIEFRELFDILSQNQFPNQFAKGESELKGKHHGN